MLDLGFSGRRCVYNHGGSDCAHGSGGCPGEGEGRRVGGRGGALGFRRRKPTHHRSHTLHKW